MQHKYKQINDIYLVISNNIKKYRIKNHMTQKELATKSGYSYAYIRQIESKSNKKRITIETIYNISLTLNINITKLFEDENI